MPMAHLLNETVAISAFTGFAGAGERIFGPAADHRARVEWNDREIKMNKDQVVAVKGRVFLMPGVTVSPNDRLTYDAVNYRVVFVTRPRDVAARADHVEAWIAEENIP